MASGRDTMAEARYGRGDPVTSCGTCRYYQGHHRCSKVMGDITPYGICDYFLAEKNPFGKTLSPNEIAAIKNMAADASDRSGAPAQGPMPGIARASPGIARAIP
jgi:hypothetical protein